MAFKDMVAGTAGRFGYDPIRAKAPKKEPSLPSQGAQKPSPNAAKVRNAPTTLVKKDDEEPRKQEGYKASEREEDGTTAIQSYKRPKEDPFEFLDQIGEMANPEDVQTGAGKGYLVSGETPVRDEIERLAPQIAAAFTATGQRPAVTGMGKGYTGKRDGFVDNALSDAAEWWGDLVEKGNTPVNTRQKMEMSQGLMAPGSSYGIPASLVPKQSGGLYDGKGALEGAKALGGAGAAADDMEAAASDEDKKSQEPFDLNAYNNDFLSYVSRNGVFDDEGNAFTNIGDFAANGTEDQWRAMLADDIMRQYYQDEYEQFGDLSDAANFSAYWDHYKPITLDQILEEGNDYFVEDWFGTDAKAMEDMLLYAATQGWAYDLPAPEGYTGFGSEGFSDYDEKMMRNWMYEMITRIAQERFDRFGGSEDFLKDWTYDEINEMTGLDSMQLLPEGAEGIVGTLAESGKTGSPKFSRNYNKATEMSYGVPFENMWRAISAAAGDPDIYYGNRQTEEQQ